MSRLAETPIQCAHVPNRPTWESAARRPEIVATLDSPIDQRYSMHPFPPEQRSALRQALAPGAGRIRD